MAQLTSDWRLTRDQYRSQLNELTFEQVCDAFERGFGRGWKRRLAEVAEVPETTVHSWLKAAKEPKWLLMNFRSMLENAFSDEAYYHQDRALADFHEAYHVVATENGFAVYRFVDGIGSIIADNIPDVDTATEIASLPRAKRTIADLCAELEEFTDSDLGREMATGELIAEARAWRRRAEIDRLDWQPDMSRTIIDTFLDILRKNARIREIGEDR
jgi:hypothetical protein